MCCVRTSGFCCTDDLLQADLVIMLIKYRSKTNIGIAFPHSLLEDIKNVNLSVHGKLFYEIFIYRIIHHLIRSP